MLSSSFHANRYDSAQNKFKDRRRINYNCRQLGFIEKEGKQHVKRLTEATDF